MLAYALLQNGEPIACFWGSQVTGFLLPVFCSQKYVFFNGQDPFVTFSVSPFHFILSAYMHLDVITKIQ